ncbi:MAG: class I SAM-dependent methyltransferase [Pseudomonadota bacterium]
MPEDYFSTQANAYQAFRPRYPQSLIDYLGTKLDKRATIVDCATGNGQAAIAFAGEQRRIIGLDLSHSQLVNAPRHAGVSWVQSTVEQIPLNDRSADLIIVAQALHWFNFAAFYAEVRRIATTNGFIAAWTYSLLAACDQFDDDIATVIRWFYHDVVGEYWPPERRWVDDEYQSIPYPFQDEPTPLFSIPISWDKDALVGYVSSWSAVALYRRKLSRNPIPLFDEKLASIWPSASFKIQFQWPLSLRFGAVH